MEQRIAPMKNYNTHNNTRCCSDCKLWKDLSEFSSRLRLVQLKNELDKKPTIYYRSRCKLCNLKKVKQPKYESAEARRKQHRKDPRKVMLMHARARAKKKGIDFDIAYDDIVIPDKCPILDLDLFVTDGCVGPNSPTIDRLDNSKGYVRGNVLVISYRANSIKRDASLEELELLVKNLKRVLLKRDELLES